MRHEERVIRDLQLDKGITEDLVKALGPRKEKRDRTFWLTQAVKKLAVVALLLITLSATSSCIGLFINIGVIAAGEVADRSGLSQRVFPKNQPPAKQSPTQTR